MDGLGVFREERGLRAIVLWLQTWIVGKWLSPREQRWAPPGTHFHQFVVPPIIGFRRDCTYGSLAAMRLPKDVRGLGSCEVVPLQ